MKLTKHFELNEFTRSATATAHGIDNSLNPTKAGDRNVIENLQHLCQTVLEPLREFVNAPVVVSSGYRCSELNKMVGGVWNSQHLTGEAADIVPSLQSGEALKQWFLFIQQNCKFDQLILETKGNRRWIHVSCRRNNQKNQMSARTMRT